MANEQVAIEFHTNKTFTNESRSNENERVT